PELLEALDHMGFTDATPIQEQAIPLILDNRDLIACAQTGTGKTAAFILPILNKMVGKEDSHINTLIIVPTRELALQIEHEIQGLSYFVSVGSMAIYGGGDGSSFNEQKDALVNGRDVIVATPGKLISHLNLGYVNFKHVKHLILDEADKMLDMGFTDDLTKIISYLPKKRQNLLFSATMAPKIKVLAKKILHNPEEIVLSLSKPAEGIKQGVHLAFDNQKEQLLKYLIDERKDYDSIIVFTSAKDKVSQIARYLSRNGIKASGISSNLDQDQREEVLLKFRSKRTRVLVATDVMSRGIDIKEINMVINYDAPRDAEDYVHRVGRTARANTKGEAITLINPKDMQKLSKIERLIEKEIEKFAMPEQFGEAPEWSNSAPPKGNHSGKPRQGGGNRDKRTFKPRKRD
ncbi:MAG: DEAD/DEAH box helicase, partial [Bacteroidota bacterium]